MVSLEAGRTFALGLEFEWEGMAWLGSFVRAVIGVPRYCLRGLVNFR